MKKNATFHTRFFFRELAHGWQHGLIFIFCVALSLTTMSALNSFKAGVNRSLFNDARELHGADIILHSNYPFSKPLLAEVAELTENDLAVASMVHEFYSVVRSAAREKTLFANIKSVDEHFPLYGKVELASGASLAARLAPGTCVVAGDVLQRLGLELGQSIDVGSARLRIVDTVVHESDSPVDMLNFGPRVFVAAADLTSIDLVKKGTRIKYEMLLQLAQPGLLDKTTARLQEQAAVGQERVNSFRDAESGVKRFFDNLLFFLSLISIFTLLLAGLGMQSCLKALLRQKEKTIAITRTVGGTSSFLYQHYLLIVLFLGCVGGVIGVGAGAALGAFLPRLFQGLLPVHGITPFRLADLGSGLVLGGMVVLLFTFVPLYRLRNIKPVAIFRSEQLPFPRDMVFYLVTMAGIVLVTFLVVRQLEDTAIGLLFMAGVIALLAVIALFAAVVVKCAQWGRIRSLSLRQALRSMTRAGNATRSIIITLASALSLLFAIYLVEYNLHTTYIESYPEDAPNLFCLDIQPDQRQGFVSFFDKEVALFPIIRARLRAINDEPINRDEELEKKRDNFAREFNLTYRDHLLEDEVISKGGALFPKRSDGVADLQVSVLDTVAAMGDLRLHDMLRFNIQGVEIEAEVTSIRSRTKSKLYPFFYFVFPPQYLQDAPQTLFSAMYLEKDTIAALQNEVLQQYPNISFINVAEAAEDIEGLMMKLSEIITFFASFSIAAGGLILVSSILATRLARIRESVYYTMLGGTRRFVYKVCIYENSVIGLSSASIGLVLAQCGSWALCHYLFEISYSPNLMASAVLVVTTVLFVVALGLLSSLAIVRQKPAGFLREYGNGE
ncbi:MAG: ABC transporter permease [Desulfopila sp.]